jgi:hypothetical protein
MWRSVVDLDIAHLKTSDTVFILGGGTSVNDVSPEDWTHISTHDSIGLNLWIVHDFVPTYYFFEPMPRDIHELFLRLLYAKEGSYARVPFISDHKHHENALSWYGFVGSYDDFPERIRTNVYLHAPFYVRTTSRALVASALVLWSLSMRAGMSRLDRIIHHRASVSALVMFSVLCGYKNVVLLGFDMTTSDYFWDERPDLYPLRPPRHPAGRIHMTADPRLTSAERAIPVDQYLRLLDRFVLASRGVVLYVGSRKSRLFPRFRLYPWPAGLGGHGIEMGTLDTRSMMEDART